MGERIIEGERWGGGERGSELEMGRRRRGREDKRWGRDGEEERGGVD